ncbi:MAG: ABC transporter permease, partial [Clostridia bacterium]|nr:ABC transporter permease [Clostridia bacterium]
MNRALILEFEKIRHRKVWLIVSAMLLVQTLWSLWSVGRMDATELAQGWMFFLYQFPLLNAIMMPVLAAVVASRLCDIEHKGHMLKLLHTVMPAGRLFNAKFLCGALYMLAAG